MDEVWLVLKSGPYSEIPDRVFECESDAKRYVEDKKSQSIAKSHYGLSDIVEWTDEVAADIKLEKLNNSMLAAEISKRHPELDKNKLEASIGLTTDDFLDNSDIKWIIKKIEYVRKER